MKISGNTFSFKRIIHPQMEMSDLKKEEDLKVYCDVLETVISKAFGTELVEGIRSKTLEYLKKYPNSKTKAKEKFIADFEYHIKIIDEN